MQNTIPLGITAIEDMLRIRCKRVSICMYKHIHSYTPIHK